MNLKLKLKTRTFFGAIKSTIDGINEKWELSEEQAKQSLENERLSLEEEMKANDRTIEELRQKEDGVAQSLNDHLSAVKRQQKIVNEATEALEALLRTQEAYEHEQHTIQRDIRQLMETQTKLNKRNQHMFEQLVALNESKKEDLSPILVKSAPVVEQIKKLIHELSSDRQYHHLFSFSPQSIQYTFVLMKNGEQEAVYYFTTSTDSDLSHIRVYKQKTFTRETPPVFAIGDDSFVAKDPANQDEIDDVSGLVLKEMRLFQAASAITA